jgi:emp24/gp25L/p24 family/GOLD
MRAAAAAALALAALVACAAALQFDLVPGASRCFTEDLAPGTPVAVSYVVVDGAGELPVTLQVRHVSSGTLIYARDAIDAAKFSFRTPGGPPADDAPDFAADRHQALPPAGADAGPWAVHDDVVDGGETGDGGRSGGGGGGNARYGPQAPPSVGENNAVAAVASAVAASAEAGVYSFCFGKTLSHGSGLLHLFPRAGGVGRGAGRRVIFELRAGAAATAAAVPAGGVRGLAKELHLRESDRLFRAVQAHVADVTRQVDQMRGRARELDEMHASTCTLITAYSVLTCVCIVVAAALSAYGAQSTLKLHKMP